MTWDKWTFECWWTECEFSEGKIEAKAAWECQQVVIDWQKSRIERLEEELSGFDVVT